MANFPKMSSFYNTQQVQQHTCTFQSMSISLSQQESADSSVDDVIRASASSHAAHTHPPHLPTSVDQKAIILSAVGEWRGRAETTAINGGGREM